MKFAVAAVVLLAVAMGVQSSLIAAGVPALGLGVNGYGLGLGVNTLGHGINGLGLGVNGLGYNNLGHGLAGHSLVQGPAYGAYGAGIVAAAHQIPAAVNFAVPQVVAQHAYAPHVAVAPVATHVVAQHVAVAQPAVVAAPLAAHGASYVAKNRGAIHTAPLPGHIKSAASINVAPAPGTW